MNSSHAVLASLALALSLTGVTRAQSIDVDRFDPRLDGLPFVNLGTFANPAGNCFGMTLVAIDNYLRRTRVIGPPAPPRPIAERPVDGYQTEQAFVSAAQDLGLAQDFRSKTENRRENPRMPKSDPEPVAQALARIKAGGPPEVLVFQGGRIAHASVLFGYADGALQIYDPNYPGETIAWPYDPVNGVGPHPKRVGYYGSITRVSVTPFHQLNASDDLAWMRQACGAGFAVCTSGFPTLDVETTVTKEGRLALRGKVVAPASDTFPRDTAKRIWIAIDGAPIGFLKVNWDYSFAALLPAEAYRPGAQVRLVSLTSDGKFAGYTDLPLPAAEPATSAGETKPRGASRGLVGAMAPRR